MTQSAKHPLRTLRPWTRHSLVLLVAGWAYIVIGLTYAVGGANPARESSMRFQIQYLFLGREGLPLSIWGAVFIAVGIASIISSRWPPFSETWGYTSMTGLSVLWAGCYAAGMAFGAPVQNLSGVITWSLIGFLWWAISGLVSPESQKQRILVLTYDREGMSVEAQSYDLTKQHGLTVPSEE